MTNEKILKESDSKTVQRVVLGYAKGQFILCLSLAALYGVGLYLTPLGWVGVVIGVAAGMLSFIPYLGFSVGAFGSCLAYGLLVAFEKIQFEIQDVLWIAAVFIVVQLLEGFLLAPRIVGRQVGLSFLPSLLAIVVGGLLFNVIGVVLAIPVAAVVKALYEKRKKSQTILKK